MYAPKYRLEAIETIGRKILLEYDRTLLEGPPQAIPIETIIETKFNLTLEYHTLRKNGSVLGETIFDDGAAILYDRTERQYRLIAVKAGTILIDERLCTDRLLGRMRFTCAHELGTLGPAPEIILLALAMLRPMMGKLPRMKAVVSLSGRQMLLQQPF